jgi:hypothetical protein
MVTSYFFINNRPAYTPLDCHIPASYHSRKHAALHCPVNDYSTQYVVACSLIDVYLRCTHVDLSRLVFDKIHHQMLFVSRLSSIQWVCSK